MAFTTYSRGVRGESVESAQQHGWISSGFTVERVYYTDGFLTCVLAWERGLFRYDAVRMYTCCPIACYEV